MTPCEKCGLPHIYLQGMCPKDDPEAFERALDSWREYDERLADRRKEGR